MRRCVWTHEDKALNYLSRRDATWSLRHTQPHDKTGLLLEMFWGPWWMMTWVKEPYRGPLPSGPYPPFQPPYAPSCSHTPLLTHSWMLCKPDFSFNFLLKLLLLTSKLQISLSFLVSFSSYSSLMISDSVDPLYSWYSFFPLYYTAASNSQTSFFFHQIFPRNPSLAFFSFLYLFSLDYMV